jgi:Predicted hydrolase (HAD superfamily)
MNNIRYVAFDADDTLWVNEKFFRDGEAALCGLLEEYASAEEVIKHLYDLEMSTLKLYGYGIKAYILSMIETAIDISGGKVRQDTIREIIEMGKTQMNRPVEVYEGVAEVLDSLRGKYELILATKGDMLDQYRKIGKSGLKDYFGHIEVMSDKKISDYRRLMDKLACEPSQFMMIGNSLKSDVVPVLEMGGYAAHVPCDVTWTHEEIDFELSHPNFRQLSRITDILGML